MLGYPVFCLRHLQAGYDIDDLQVDDQRHFLKRMRHLSRIAWADVEQAPRHGVGKENISRGSLRVAVPVVMEEVDTVWALRFTQRKAIVGWRSGDVFHVVWIDHDFSVYRHG